MWTNVAGVVGWPQWAAKHPLCLWCAPLFGGLGRKQKEGGKTCDSRSWQCNKESKNCSCKWNQKRNSFTAFHPQADVQLCPGKQPSARVRVVWESKCHKHKCPLFLLLLSPSFCRWAQCHVVWDVPLLTWGVLSLTVSPPRLLPTLCLLGGGWTESLGSGQALPSSSQGFSLSSNTVLAANPKHGSVWVARRKGNSILGRPNTAGRVAWVPSI